MKHIISLQELAREELLALIHQAVELKRRPEQYAHACEGKGLLMLFQKTSTRTNLSFQAGIQQLGGYPVVMDWDASNFSISPIQYEARYVSRNSSAIMARLKRHEDLQELARYATVPVINGCCNKYHPCQALADLMTIYEVAGRLEGVTLTYVGVHNNVVNSLIAGCVTLGVHLQLVTPIINEAAWDEPLMHRAYQSGYVERKFDLREAVAASDFVYTDTWIDMEFFDHPDYQEEKQARIAQMLPYQLNREVLAGCSPYIMHDMPIHPGYEITADLVESERSIIYQQGENRLHAQKALLQHLFVETARSYQPA